MIEEAIILAGGKGTRLKSSVSELPKTMAPINGIPFLSYQLDYLAKHNIKTIYLAVGYLSHKIKEFYGDTYKGMCLTYSHENKPLGTGGAISKALKDTIGEHVFVLNGDTLFHTNFAELANFHESNDSIVTIALKEMEDFDRYGVVRINTDKKVVGFEEKKRQQIGLINGGVYALNTTQFKKLNLQEAYSFEQDFLENHYSTLSISGFVSKSYFLDIGIPSDYHRAHEDFKEFGNWKIDRTWTLFLDRDGVINQQITNGYVTSVDEFQFLEGVLDCFSKLTRTFGRIVVVTNQQCIGKKIIGLNELTAIHDYMKNVIEKHGGKINQIYFAPDLASKENLLRKPNTGMAEMAVQEFPEIDFNKAIIVGDSPTDIEFGKRKNMKTVLISKEISSLSDKCFESLEKFSKSLS